MSKVDGAIMELIKNTYDADAQNCILYFDVENDRIYIVDDGVGMTKEIIENFWMVIGTDNKKIEYKSEKNRIKSGEKGIGRFALDRLGSKCEMFTKNSNSKVVHWINDWNNFEIEGKSLDEVEAEIEEKEGLLNKFLPKELEIELLSNNIYLKTGTIISISCLRDEWPSKEIDKISNSLCTIVPPTEQDDFNLFIKKNKNTQCEKLENIFEENFDYKIEAQFDGEFINLKIFRNEFDLKLIPKAVFENERFKIEPYRYDDFEKGVITKKFTISELIKNSNEELIAKIESIGSFRFNYVFMKKTTQEDFGDILYYKSIPEKRTQWINNNYGIKIYRDNFAVRPYGDINSESSDWLGLDTRRAKDPAGIGHKRETWHVGNKQGQGTLFISRVTNKLILDKSSREGIIENESFFLLKQLLISIISQFEKDRAYIGRTFNEYQDFIDETRRIALEGKNIAHKINKNKNKNKIIKLSNDEQEKLAKAFDILNTEKDELISENKLLRSLATNGLITTSIVHDLKTIQGFLVNRADLFKIAIEENDINDINNNLDDLKTNDKFLFSWISVITNQKKDKRTRKNHNIVEIINSIVEIMNPILTIKQTKIDFVCQSKKILKKLFVNDLESIFYNLIINSIEIFEQKRVRNRKIEILLEDSKDNILIFYSDNGPGLDKCFKDPYEIFKYGVTTKIDVDTGERIGTGLGMYIIDSTINEYNGEIIILEHTNNFKVKIVIPK